MNKIRAANCMGTVFGQGADHPSGCLAPASTGIAESEHETLKSIFLMGFGAKHGLSPCFTNVAATRRCMQLTGEAGGEGGANVGDRGATG